MLTTPHFFVPGKFEAVLGIPKTVTLAAIIPVGYPVGKFGPVKRPPAEAGLTAVRGAGFQPARQETGKMPVIPTAETAVLRGHSRGDGNDLTLTVVPLMKVGTVEPTLALPAVR